MRQRLGTTVNHLTDDQLLRRFAGSGDADAFAELTRRHLDMVLATCRRETGDVALAEDAAQAAFLLLAQRSKRLTSERNLAAWLFVAARHTARNARRSERRRQVREHTAHLLHQNAMQDAHSAEEAWNAIEPRLNEAMARLRPDDREAILLRFMQGHSLAELAERFGVAENAVRMRLSRAMDRLRSQLARAGLVVPLSTLERALEIGAAAPASTLAPATVAAIVLNGTAPTIPLLTKGGFLIMASTAQKFIASAALGLVLLAGVGTAVVQARRSGEADAASQRFFKPLLGKWKGELRYYDFSLKKEDRQVTQAEFRYADDRRKVTLISRYPKFGTLERTQLELRPEIPALRLTEGNKTKEARLEGFPSFLEKGSGTVTMLERDQDEILGKVDRRTLLTLQGDRLTYRTEVRAAGTKKPWAFRAEYDFVRENRK